MDGSLVGGFCAEGGTQAPLVPVVTRTGFLRALCDAGSLELSDARHIEQEAYLQATRSVSALDNAEDPLAAMVSSADVAQSACTAYCAALQRVVLFLFKFGHEKLKAWVSSQQTEHSAQNHSQNEDPVGQDCVDTTNLLIDGKTWQEVLGSLDDSSAAKLAAALGGWGGWAAVLKQREEEALRILLRDRKAEKKSIYTCANTRCGSNDVDEDIVQARSLDEGHTVYLRCNVCGTKSKMNT